MKEMKELQFKEFTISNDSSFFLSLQLEHKLLEDRKKPVLVIAGEYTNGRTHGPKTSGRHFF